MEQSKDSNDRDTEALYHSVVSELLEREHVFYSPATSLHKLQIQQQQRSNLTQLPTIASLSLHPVVESLLHILNCDLPSAHFLCRHAEVEPKWESMYVHGILHRVEGDIDNCRSWYGQVKETDLFVKVWQEKEKEVANLPEIAHQGWEHFLDRLERYRDRTKKRATKVVRDGSRTSLKFSQFESWADEEEHLRETSLWEIKQVLRLCEQKFGIGEIADARKEFLGRIESGDTRLAKIAEEMITGGEGWRIF